MAGRPCPMFYYSLPIVASVVVIPTTVAPTVGPGRSGRCSATRSNLPINDLIATDRMIAISEMLQILPSSYVPAARPVTHSMILPVGTISLFVGLTDIIASEANHADELAKYASGVNNDDPTILKKPNSEGANTSAFEATTHTRTVELVPGDSSQTVTIGTGMSPA